MAKLHTTSVCEKTFIVLSPNITKYLCKKKIILIFKNATHHRNFPSTNAFFKFRRYYKPDNLVRLIYAFVEYIDISKLDFAIKMLKTEGRPSFNSKVFLKIYLYGYLNGIRSGRDIEKKCFRNIEIQRLLEGIRPNYHNITAFRKITQSHQRTLSNYLFRS